MDHGANKCTDCEGRILSFGHEVEYIGTYSREESSWGRQPDRMYFYRLLLLSASFFRSSCTGIYFPIILYIKILEWYDIKVSNLLELIAFLGDWTYCWDRLQWHTPPSLYITFNVEILLLPWSSYLKIKSSIGDTLSRDLIRICFLLGFSLGI